MSTGVIIALIVVGVVVVVAAGLFAARTGPRGGRGLRRRFGPEYDRVVARHDGDTKAAEHELSERVRQHGSLKEQELEPAARERYQVRWAGAQEHFVTSPEEAVAEADRLLAGLAKERGFPDGGRYDEQFAALSVHHGPQVDGYRRLHRAAHARPGRAEESRAGTEELRTAMVEARALFEVLLGTERPRGAHRPTDRTAAAERQPDAKGHALKGRLAKGN
ncbi:hypothetical protein [Streptomyces sp. VRA16 Mangrove soil]|uniref:hypothetical protein n=1 Tax=Streptomyces sp. VRA16 Mangrove soil TaxID=2817434 RepID=UPI001A9DD3F1|nr:hypothetical protein [Streptomyces sp. VRA16 Mangrove soil]MBO1333105.1 hypothetical protein [Streptomyces sp. VRA16 Mangrove soil]